MVDSLPVSSLNAAFPTVTPNFPGGLGRLADIGGLTLANGMTAGWGVNDGNMANPPMGGNATSAINPYGEFSTSVWPMPRIGVMRNAPMMGPAGKTYSLYFLYNPSDVTVDFTINTNAMPAVYQYGTNNNVQSLGVTADNGGSGGAVPSIATSQVVTWQLFFDRTYDMMYDPNPGENRGVLKDVAALYNLLGTFNPGEGYPASYAVQVVFGQTSSGQLWGFTGFISSVRVVYGLFKNNMIPSRCEVDLGMMLTYVTNQANPGSGNPGASYLDPVTGSNYVGDPGFKIKGQDPSQTQPSTPPFSTGSTGSTPEPTTSPFSTGAKPPKNKAQFPKTLPFSTGSKDKSTALPTSPPFSTGN